MKFKRTVLAVSISAAIATLTACGGGGGGGAGPSGSNSAAISSQVPFYTPTRVGAIVPLVTSTYNYGISTPLSVDLTGTGKENVVIYSTESASETSSTDWKSSKLFVYGWSGNNLVDQTSQWFSGTDNVVVGANMVKFGDLAGNGLQSMFVAPYTDERRLATQISVFVNEGSRFSRYNIDLPYTLNSHDSTLFRYNGVDNAVAVDYGLNTTFVFGSNTRDFRAYSVNSWTGSGSAIAAGDFTGSGRPTFIIGDTGFNRYSTRLIDWAFNGSAVTLTEIGILPLPRFELPKYDGVLVAPSGQNRSHTVRILTEDFDNSGITSAIVISRPSVPASGIGSEVQFLKNNGVGVFTDVTDSILVNYDTKANASYNPVVMDVNKDGLRDIVLAGAGIGDPQVLIHTKEGKYVASYATVLTDFQNQVKSIQGTIEGDESMVLFVRGPDNNLYLLNMVSIGEANQQSKVLYLSKVGSLTGSNAQATIASIKQAWPYMSDAQVNTLLASTGKTWFGAIMINEDAIWTPSGQLGVSTVSGLKPIHGIISGIKLNGADTGIVAMDSFNRSWRMDLASNINPGRFNSFGLNSEHVDQFDLTSHTEYLINAKMITVGQMRVGVENNYDSLSSNAFPKNYSIGIPNIWRNNNWSFGVQYTTLSHNPWVAVTGAWGEVTSSTNVDYVLSYNKEGWTGRLGLIQTTTQLNPGLVTKVSPIVGAWGEVGYREKNLGVYVGTKPQALSGSVEVKLPTGIDNYGNIMYTNKKFGLQNQAVSYVRSLYQVDLTKTSKMQFGATLMSNGQYRITNEYKWTF